MIIELITPLMIATAPVQIQNAEPFKYDHAKQMVEVKEGEVTTLSQRMPTYNGTQTYNYQGRPSDNDND